MNARLSLGTYLLIAATILLCASCSYTRRVEPIIVNESINVTFPDPGYVRSGYQFVTRTDAHYPREALDQGISGTVVVHARVQADGTVLDAFVPDRVHPLLDSAALRSVRECVFSQHVFSGGWDYLDGIRTSTVVVSYEFQ